MKNHLFILALGLVTLSCNDRAETKDPADVHPPTEAIPQNMEIENDSAITPDTGERRVINEETKEEKNP